MLRLSASGQLMAGTTPVGMGVKRAAKTGAARNELRPPQLLLRPILGGTRPLNVPGPRELWDTLRSTGRRINLLG